MNCADIWRIPAADESSSISSVTEIEKKSANSVAKF
jgi:hypothetical protein